MEKDETSPLLAVAGSDKADQYRTYWTRFVVLGIFSLVAFQQDNVWITYGIVSDETKAYYGVSDNQVNLLAAWGPIMYLPAMPVASWFMEKKGIRATVFSAVLMLLVGAGIRLFAEKGGHLFWLVHVGQAINGLAGPMIMQPPPRLSAVWFPPNQRTTATAIGTMAPYVGTAAAFIFIPYVTDHYGMQTMLLVQFVLAGIATLAVCIYFPEEPPSPPSPSAEVMRLNLSKALSLLGHNKTFWILAVCGGVTSGVFNAWASVLSLVLNSHEGYVTEMFPVHSGTIYASTSWIGFVSTVCGIVVAWLAGPLADCFPGRLKLLILVLFGIAALFYFWFSLAAQHLIPGSSKATVFYTVVIASVFLNAANPLFYEACVEATYPVPESFSVGFLATINCLSCLLFQVGGFVGLFSDAHPRRAKAMNWILTGFVAFCWVLALFYKESYARLKADGKDVEKSSEERKPIFGRTSVQN